jgi:hypothetical protein
LDFHTVCLKHSGHSKCFTKESEPKQINSHWFVRYFNGLTYIYTQLAVTGIPRRAHLQLLLVYSLHLGMRCKINILGSIGGSSRLLLS